jgi:acyl dehydratase
MVVLTGTAEVKERVGEELGVSEWHSISQQDVDRFADVTGDHQWIHVDPRRATDAGFGGTITHGYFTLSLTPWLAETVYAFEGFDYALNYGLDRVRYPSPMPVGERVRMRAELTSATDVDGGLQVKITHTFEREGSEKPVCVAEALLRLFAAQG